MKRKKKFEKWKLEKSIKFFFDFQAVPDPYVIELSLDTTTPKFISRLKGWHIPTPSDHAWDKSSDLWVSCNECHKTFY